MPTQIIIVNGPSSSGKTSVARALQTMLGDTAIYVGLDTYLPSLPPHLHHTAKGASYREVAAGVVMDFGPSALRLLSAWHHAVGAIARSGAPVIVDEVIVSEEVVRSYIDALGELRPWLIGLACDVDVLVARENARADRVPGLAAGTASVVHKHLDYDQMVDTGTMTPEAAADLIFQATSLPNTPQAFARLKSGVVDPR